MAKKKKNSNYVTPKTIAAKEAMEAAKRRLKIKKILIPSVIAFLILALIVGAVFAIGVPLGMLDYKPEATGHVSIEFEGYEDTMHIELYGNDAAENITVQYGGSMNDANAAELLAKVNVDGGLIGGASLKVDKFTTIVKAANA